MSIHPHIPAAPTAAAAVTALVPVRERRDGWTAEKQRDFIEALADTGSVRAAAAAVDMSEQSAYRLRRRADAAAFDAAWEAALERGLALLAATAFERAVHGTVRTRWWRGEKVAEERVYSDRLLVWLLKHGRGVLGRAAERRALKDDWEQTVSRLREPEVIGEPPGGYRVWMSDFGDPLTNFPPPEDFHHQGLFQEGKPGEPGYRRRLSEAEEDAYWERHDDAPAPAEIARDRFFGFAAAADR